MKRPADIPPVVWATAIAVTKTMPTAFGWGKITEEVARAILAERKRCAAVCDAEVEQAKKFGPHHVPIILSVRKAILDGEQS